MVTIKTYYDTQRSFAQLLLKPSYQYINGYDVASEISAKLQIKDQNNSFINIPKTLKEDLFPCVIVLGELRWKEVLQVLSKDIKERENILILLNACLGNPKFQRNQAQYNIIQSEINFWKNEKEWLEQKQKGIAKHYNQLLSFLNNKFSFFNNSSIWVRVVNWDDDEIMTAQKELEYFRNIGLYDYDSAIENLDYNIRLQPENYLDSKTQGHGVYVTPVLYGDESEHRRILFEDNKPIENT